MSRILFIDFHNVAPHIETSFELAKRHLEAGDQVAFYFLGHDVPYREFLSLSKLEARIFRRWMPERRAARLLRHPNFEFVPGQRLTIEPLSSSLPRSLEELEAFRYDGADIGMGVASSLISRTGNSQFDPSKYPRTVRNALEGSIAVYRHCLDLIETVGPDLVYVFNGRLCHPRAALRAAQHVSANVQIHERGADKSRFVVRSFTPHDRQRIQEELVRAWDASGQTPEAIATARTWYEERRSGQPRDWHSFTDHQVPSLVPELPAGKRIVSYFSSSDDELAAIGKDFRWEGWHDQLHAVQDLIAVMKNLPESHLVIRIHPHLLKKHPDDLARWIELCGRNPSITTLGPDSPVDSYALLETSDIVVTGGSTMGMEAVYWGRPSILLGPSDYDLLGAVHIARSVPALEGMLRTPDLKVDPASALPYGYYRATFGEAFEHFEPHSLMGGRFLGTDLHRLPPLAASVNRAKEWILSRLRRSHATTPKELPG